MGSSPLVLNLLCDDHHHLCHIKRMAKKHWSRHIIASWPTNATGWPLPNKFSTNWRRYTRTFEKKKNRSDTLAHKNHRDILPYLKNWSISCIQSLDIKNSNKKITPPPKISTQEDNQYRIAIIHFLPICQGHKCAHIFSVTNAQDIPHAAKHFSPSIHTLIPHLPGTAIYSAGEDWSVTLSNVDQHKIHHYMIN